MANAEIKITAKGVEDVNRKLGRLGKSFDRLKAAGAGLRTSFRRATIAGAAMAAGLAIVINRTLSSIDATAKLSRNIDISTESLAAFSLQARIGGVSTDVMNKSLSKMMKNIGDAALGFGTAKTLLDRLNIDIQKLANLKPEEQFQFMAEAIKGMTTRAEKLSFAVAIFGRQGIGLIEVLEGGSAAFEAAAKDTKLFGTAISKVDAKKVEEFNDQMTRLKEVAAGAANTITLRFVEGMKPVIDGLIEGARESSGFKDEVNALADAFTGLGLKSVSAISKTLKALKETRQFFARHPILEKVFQIGAAPLSLPFTGAKKSRNIVTGSWPDERPQRHKINTFLADAKKAIDAAIPKDQPRQTRAVDFQKEAQSAVKQADMVARKIRLDKQGVAITKEMRTEQEKLNDRLKELNELRAAGAISQETLSRGSKKAIEDFNSSIDTAKNGLIDMKAVSEQVARSMQSNFSDFFFNLGTEVNSFSSLWQSTLNTVRRAVADFTSQKTIGILKNLFTGGGTGGSTSQGNVLSRNFTKSTKEMFETFRTDKADMDRHFEDNLRGLGIFVDNTARGMSLDFKNSFFTPTSQRLNSFAERFKAVIGSLRDSIGGLIGALGGGGRGGDREGFGFNAQTAIQVAQIAAMFGHEGGEVGSLPTRQLSFAGVPRMHSGGEVAAVLRNDEFVVSPGGTKAAGVDVLNRINKGDLSDLRGGGGSGVISNVNIMIQAIDTQTGLDFITKPEIAEAVEANIEKAIMDNSRIRDAIEQGRK